MAIDRTTDAARPSRGGSGVELNVRVVADSRFEEKRRSRSRCVTYDFDRAANFSKYKAYAWTRGTELTDELNHARVIRAVDAALVTKGLSRVEPGTSPDVLVAYHASFDKNLETTGSAHG